MNSVDESLKQTIDVLSFTTVFGTLMGVMPSVAALFSIIWSCVRLWETKTVQDLYTKWFKKDQ